MADLNEGMDLLASIVNDRRSVRAARMLWGVVIATSPKTKVRLDVDTSNTPLDVASVLVPGVAVGDRVRLELQGTRLSIVHGKAALARLAQASSAKIPGAADLDAYTTQGTFYQNLNADAATGTNYPEPYAGMLEVLRATSGMLWQRYTSYGTNSKLWRRAYYSGTWYPWEEVGAEVAPPPAADDALIAGFISSTTSASMSAAATAAGVFNARTFGAVGNDSTNNTAALQAALDAAAGGTLVIPPGIYRCNATLRVRANTRIVGYGATIKRITHTASMLVNFDAGDTSTTGYNGAGNIVIEGLTVDGNSAPTPGGLILLIHSHDIALRDMTFLTCTVFHHLELNSTRDALVENCRFLGYIPDTTNTYQTRREAIQVDHGNASQGGAADGTVSVNVTVRDCYFGPDHRGNGGPTICVGTHTTPPSGYYRNIQVLNCVGEDLRLGGVWVKLATDVVVDGCKFTLKAKSPIHHDEASMYRRGVYFEDSSNRSTVSNTTVIMDSGDTKARGFVIDNSQRCAITGCVAEDGDIGMAINMGAGNNTASNNVIYRALRFGAYIDRASNNILSGNNFQGCQYGGEGGPVVNVVGVSGNLARFNTIQGNVSSPHGGSTQASVGVSIGSNAGTSMVVNNRMRGLASAYTGPGSDHASGNINT